MKLLIIVVLLVVVGVAGYLVYQSNGQKPVGQPTINQESNITPKSEAPSDKGNFSQKGNVSIQEDGGLWLVWDEPGRLALNVKLSFTGESTCILGGQKKDCGLLNKSQENYYANVEGEKSGNEVTVDKLEEVKPPQ